MADKREAPVPQCFLCFLGSPLMTPVILFLLEREPQSERQHLSLALAFV